MIQTRWKTILRIACLIFFGAAMPRSMAQDQNGLRVEYYAGSASYGDIPDRATLFSPNNLRKVGLATAIDYNSNGVNPPADGLPPDHYGVRWLGQILIDKTGYYVFYASSRDGSRFWLSDRPIDPKTDAPLLDIWNPQISQNDNATPVVPLEAGVRYYLLFEMYDDMDSSYAYLHQRDGSDLPTDRLFPAIPEDQTPPDAIKDLTVVATTKQTATLRWTATGDDSGNASFYDLRYSLSPIDASNFDRATPAIFAPAPASPGQSQTYVVSGLASLQTYHFAMKAGDAAGNLSAVSNDATGSTQKIDIPAAPENGLLHEDYFNLPFLSYASIDTMMLDARYPGDPDVANYLPTFATPSDAAMNYGERVRGYVTAPQTGDYVFWITADDCGELYLSPDEDPAHAKEIALVPDYELEGEWDKFVKQASDPVPLEAGKRYYIEALHGQITGGSHLTVRWRLPDNKMEQPIPKNRLTPYPYPKSLGRLHGVVTDAKGAPLSGIRVLVTQGDYEFGGHTNDDGYYTTMAPSGLVQVSAYQPDSPYDARSSVVAKVSPGVSSAVDLALPYDSSISTRVTIPLSETSGGEESSVKRNFKNAWLAANANDDLFISDSASAVGKMNVAGEMIPILSGDPWLSSANLKKPKGLAVNRKGDLFIADSANNRILKLDVESGAISVVAGTGMSGYSGDGGFATLASLNLPYGIAVDDAGNLFIADYYNNRIRKVDPNGIISSVAGTGTAGFSGDGGLAVLANISRPYDVAVDGEGNLYIADSGSNRVRKVDANGVISTIAGTSNPVGDGNAGLGSLTGINTPNGLATDALGNLYILSYPYIYRVNSEGFLDYYSGYYGNISIEVNSLGDLFVSNASPYVTKASKAAGPGLLSPISLSVPNSSALPAGETVQLAATDSRDPSAPPSSFQWSVDGLPGGSAEVGRIDANGLFTAPLNAGNCVLTAEHDGAIGALKATVIEPDAPLLSLGSATLDPGASATLSISATAALTDVSGLDLLLRAVGPDGAPPLTPVLERRADAKDWQVLPDPGDPWHLTILNPSGAAPSGPAELMRLTVTADASAPHGATYAISARSLLATTSDGRWRTNRARVSPGSVSISKAAKGDMNGDGRIDMKDVTLSLRLALGLDPSSASAIAAGDANCDGKLTIIDATLLLQKAVGLSPAAWCEG